MDKGWLFLIGLAAVLLVWRNRNGTMSDQAVRSLYRQSARYVVASLQDESEVIRVLHANYAMGYLLAIKDVTTDVDFERITGERLADFEDKVVAAQDVATKLLIKQRPDLMPLKDDMLVRAIYSRD
jgi:hypothetical protein